MMRHILKPLLRHRMMPMLVIVQVALACAIACNAAFLLQQQVQPILRSDGIGQPDHLIVAWQIVPRGEPWPASRLLDVEATLRAIPGVTSVSVAGSLPMVTIAQMNGEVIAQASRTKANAAIYVGDHLVRTLELNLVAGRDFNDDEQAMRYEGAGLNQNGPAIITQALADRLFPDGNALGQVIRIGKDADAGRRTVVGVVAHLLRNDLYHNERRELDYTMLFPGIPGHWPIPSFGVRVGTADPHNVRKSVKQVVQRMLGAQMVQGVDPVYDMYARLRDRALAKAKATVWLLGGVSIVVLIVTLVGIMGMTSYWVQQRTRQIGIRRALGARRSDILRYLQLENLLVVGVGVLLGLLLAYIVNFWLMRHYELMRLPWTYLPVGALLLLALGQIAVLSPALRASRVPPVVATRSA